MLVGKPVVGVGREVLGQRVAEAHVHGALDLALAQQRVDRPADVVDGDDPLDRCRSRGRSRPAGRRSRTRSGSSGSGRPGRRACAVQSTTVLAVVVDVRPAAVGQRRRARVGAPSRRAISVPRDAGGLPEAELAGGVDDDVDARRVDAELLRRRPAGRRCARPGPSRSSRGAPRPGRRRRKRTTALGDLAEAVAEAGVLEPEPEPDRLARGDARRRTCGLIASRQASAPPAAVVHDLARPPHVAGRDRRCACGSPSR